MDTRTAPRSQRLAITDMLRPHFGTLGFALLAAAGEAIGNLLEPWPLKVVIDNVLRSRRPEGWSNQLVFSLAGSDPLAVLRFAVAAVLAIAAIGALCSYLEKYL